MASGLLSSEALVHGYLDRIERYDRRGPAVHAVRLLAPDALDQARARDDDRRRGDVRGPLHGIPVLVKDNIDVAGLPTTAGSLALEHSTPQRDAALVTRLREAGAVILGKANLTEFANFMAEDMPSGYSSLGGQVLNPYDASVTPSGSSSGSGAAAALGLATVAVGTETDGSILAPCDAQSLVGVKPTLGLVSSEGILPIASSQDCAGPMTRTVYDAAALLGALTGDDYVRSLDDNALQGSCLVVPAVAGRPARRGSGAFRRGAAGAARPWGTAGRGAGAAHDRRVRRAALRVRPRPRRLPCRGCPRGRRCVRSPTSSPGTTRMPAWH